MKSFHASIRHLVFAASAVVLAVCTVPAADDVAVNDDVVVDDAAADTAPAEAPANQGRLRFRVQVQGGAGLQLQAVQQGLQLNAEPNAQPNAQGNQGGAAAADAEVKKEPYLGVVVGPVPDAVRAQIDLPEGVGLSVEAVAPGGPAEKAGLKQHDVVSTFNDQILVSPEQLRTLVKVVGAGTKAPLEIIRGGKRQTVEAVLEERDVQPDGVAAVFAGQQIPEEVLQAARMQQPVPAWMQQQPAFALPALRLEQQLVRRGNVGNGGVTSGRTFGPGGQEVATWFSDDKHASYTDDRGTVVIRKEGDGKVVTVTDPAGAEVYSGPYATDADLEKIPEDYRDWVAEVGRTLGWSLAAEADDADGAVPAAE